MLANTEFLHVPILLGKTFTEGVGYTVKTGFTQPIMQAELRSVFIHGELHNIDESNNFFEIEWFLDVSPNSTVVYTIEPGSYTIEELLRAMTKVVHNNNPLSYGWWMTFAQESGEAEIGLMSATMAIPAGNTYIGAHMNLNSSQVLMDMIGAQPGDFNTIAMGWDYFALVYPSSILPPPDHHIKEVYYTAHLPGLFMGEELLYIECPELANLDQFHEAATYDPTFRITAQGEKDVLAVMPFSRTTDLNSWTLQPGTTNVYTFPEPRDISTLHVRIIAKNIGYQDSGFASFGTEAGCLLNLRVATVR